MISNELTLGCCEYSKTLSIWYIHCDIFITSGVPTHLSGRPLTHRKPAAIKLHEIKLPSHKRQLFFYLLLDSCT